MTITTPEAGELTIEVLEHDPEVTCIGDDRVATHDLCVRGACGKRHPICLTCAEAWSRWIRRVNELGHGRLPMRWMCVPHANEFTAVPADFHVIPLGRS